MNHTHFENAFPDTVRYDSNESLRHVLREHLLALHYPTFLLLIAQLLERQGCQHVHLLGRKGFVGRNRSGGWDLEAILPPAQSFANGQQGVRCIIQVKQFDDLAVQQRTIDELRGCCLRARAGQGLLVTLSRFSPVAVQAAEASVLAPITLIDGAALLDLLMQYGMGIVRTMSGLTQVDQEFFQSLSANADRLTGGASRVAKLQKRQDKRTGNLSKPSDPQASLVAKTERRQATVLYFSVTLDAQGRGIQKRAKLQ